jgi:hypothetical protein
MRVLMVALVAALLVLAACGGDGRDEAAFLDFVRSGGGPSPAVAGDAELIAVGDLICDGDGDEWLEAVPGGWLTGQSLTKPAEVFLADLVLGAEEHLCP